MTARLIPVVAALLAALALACGPGGSAPSASAPAKPAAATSAPAAPAAQAPSKPAGAPAAAPAAPAAAPARVRMATQNNASDVAAFLAADHGYFQQEGIELEFVSFSSASEMMPALATSQVEVSSIAGNPAGFNAVARGVDFKMVVDKGSFYGGYGDQYVVVRKDLYDRGRGHRLEDLRGLGIAITPPGKGTVSACAMAAGLRRVGMTLDDIDIQPVPFPEMVAALTNGAVDGGMVSEPFLAGVMRQGTAVKVLSVGDLFPGFQFGVVGFSKDLYANRPVAKAWVRAYLRAARAYNAALADRPTEFTRDQIYQSIAKYSRIDPAVVREMAPPGINPNGQPHRESILYCYQFFREQGLIPEPVSEAAFAALWGTDLVDEVLAEIGRVPES
jgi:NitT/TauT family transport system substrate-binding protein